MAKRIGEHFRGNVVAYLAVFLVLGGTAVALPGRNTVQSNDIGPGAQVTNRDTKPIKPSWVKDPTPKKISTFVNGWAAHTGAPGASDDAPVRVWKDLSGTVHLEGGLAHSDSSPPTSTFRLPAGFRPAAHFLSFAVVTTGESDTNEVLGYIQIAGDCCGEANTGRVSFFGGNPEYVSLDGISFRAAD